MYVKHMENKGIAVMLAGAFAVMLGGAYEAVYQIIATKLLGTSLPWWASYPGYVLFWTGIAVFAAGTALTLFYALVHAFTEYEQYKAFKTALKKDLKGEK